jgi:pimeloyl-ACP methyl ester carboxylesterase
MTQAPQARNPNRRAAASSDARSRIATRLFFVLAACLWTSTLVAGEAEAGSRLSQCGGNGQRACTIFEIIPSCDPFLFENLESCGFLCTQSICRPVSCGGLDQRFCVPFVDHAYSALCKAGLYSDGSRCRRLDADGFPPSCGDDGEPACSLDLQSQIGINSCKPMHFEQGFPLGTCRKLDADGFPQFCGDDGEGACTIDLQVQLGIGPCKKNHVHNLLAGRCFEFTPPSRVPWPPAEESAGPRTIFLVHGSGSKLKNGFPASAGGMAVTLARFHQVYGIDYNSIGEAARRFSVDELSQGAWINVEEFGEKLFDGRDFTLAQVSAAFRDAILALPTEPRIALVAHSLGGIVVRDLVSRHYDELRLQGKRITEVVTLASPHDEGSFLQESLACAGLTPGLSPEQNWQLCLLQVWHGAIDGLDVSIDNQDFPQIHWVTVAGDGHPAPDPTDSRDGDGVVATLSAFGIAMDDCFPSVIVPGATAPSVVEVAVQGRRGAKCHKPPSEIPPCYRAVETLSSAGHSLQVDPDVIAFVLWVLSQDRDGDGIRDVCECGDASGDAFVNTTVDALFDPLTRALCDADCNRDGSVTAADVTCVVTLLSAVRP